MSIEPSVIAKMLRDLNTDEVLEMAAKDVFIDKVPLEDTLLVSPISLDPIDILAGLKEAVKQIITEEVYFLRKEFGEGEYVDN